MDIAALSMGMSQVNLMQQVDLSIIKMAMETGSRQMDGLVEMIEPVSDVIPSPDPNIGQILDVKV